MNGNYSDPSVLAKRHLVIGLKFMFERNRRLKCCGRGGGLQINANSI